jgi:ABC-type glycerol-3-phosphate transport system substrate-binding protein
MGENMPDNWGITYMPIINGKVGANLGGNGLAPLNATRYPDATAKLLSFIATKENQRQFCQTTNFNPTLQSLYREGMEYSVFNDEMKTVMEIISQMDPKMTADETAPRYQRINMVMGEELASLGNGQISAEQALAQMDRRFKEILEE